MTPFCENCGGKLQIGDRFCSRCGSAVASRTQTSVAQPPQLGQACSRCGGWTTNKALCDRCTVMAASTSVPTPTPSSVSPSSSGAAALKGCNAVWTILAAAVVVVVAWPILGPLLLLALAAFVVAVVAKAVFSK